MTHVFGFRSWVFWWAGLTATVFLQDWLGRLAAFFRDKSIFTTKIPPFSLVTGVDGWIDGAAEYIRNQVKFDPSGVIAGAGPLTIYNWMIAAFLGLIILVFAALLYLRALGTSALFDDFIALFALYFVLRIESHLVAIANFPFLSGAGRSIIGNPVISFGLLMLLVLILALTGEGLRSPRSFWRAIFEALLVAILLFPVQAGAAVAAGFDLLREFGALVQTNLTFGLIWGLVGMLLALRRLYYVDAHA